MKVFFDTNVYVAEALVGSAAERIIDATVRARWRIYCSKYVVDEVVDVLTDDLDFSRRLTAVAKKRILRRSVMAESCARAQVPGDPKDSPILQAALGCGADYLVSNDRHLLSLDPFEDLRIISMHQYHDLLRHQGLL